MPLIVTRVTIEGLSNIISCAYEGRESEMIWEEFQASMPPPFDTQNLFYVGFEPDRGLYCVERRGGLFSGEESPEITWVRENLLGIVRFIEQNSQQK
jgi:hypothetical protein